MELEQYIRWFFIVTAANFCVLLFLAAGLISHSGWRTRLEDMYWRQDKTLSYIFDLVRRTSNRLEETTQLADVLEKLVDLKATTELTTCKSCLKIAESREE